MTASLAALLAHLPGAALADPLVASETGAAEAVAKFGITGKGVIVAILDRGIDYTLKDFRNADGTTRIKYMLDMSGQNLCASNNPAPVEYTAATINAAGGPTRDGRVQPNGGVDVTTPGGNSFAAYAPNSVFGEYATNYIQDGGGFYGRQSATSASAPIAAGAAALLLQMNPALTGAELKALIHATARHDSFTGSTPNLAWGYGKLDVYTAAYKIAEGIPANPVLSAAKLAFADQKVGTSSAVKAVTLKNTGTATLSITSVLASGDFHVSATTCPSHLAAGSSCAIDVDFHPTVKGARTGTLSVVDFNIHSPEGVALTGTGD